MTARPADGLHESPPADWDHLAVDLPGGHVYQSVAWAEHRATTGWRPMFHVAGAGRTLALVRSWPLIPGGSAYLPRGPAPVVNGTTLATRLEVAAAALAGQGIDVVAADPEVPAADRDYGRAIGAAGWRSIAEIQPSRHRLAVPLGSGPDEAAALSGVSKATRQRIRQAERSGLIVVRHDVPGEPGEGFRAPGEPSAAAFDRFVTLLRATGDRRGFHFGPAAEFTAWWSRALAAGHLVFLEARSDGDPIAGLLLYRHGRRLTTVHSADRAELRRAHPGVLHLLRWRALQLAIREGRAELDLGGVDVAGARGEPRPGEPTYGLYEHKRSFGASWIELTGAHERAFRPWRYAAGRAVAGVARRIGRMTDQ